MASISDLKFQVKTNIIVFFILNLGSVSNYLFQILFGRALSPQDYGTLNAVMALASTLSAVALVMPMVVSRMAIPMIARGNGQVAALLFYILKFLGLFLFILSGGCLIFIDELMVFLHLETPIPIYILTVQVTLSLLFPTFNGVIQAQRRYLTYSLGSFAAMFARLVAGVAVITLIGGSVIGGLSAVVFGSLVALLIALWATREVLRAERMPLPEGIGKDILRYALPVGISSMLFTFLMNMDMILVHHYLTNEASGTYAAASLLGKIMLYLPTVVAGVMFPETVRKHNSGASALHVLATSLGLLAVVAIIFFTFVFVFGEQMIVLLYGDAYREAYDLLKVLTVAMALLAATQLIFSHCMALHDFKFLWVQALGAFCLLTSVYFFHQTSQDIAYAVSAVSLGMMTAAGILVAKRYRLFSR